MQNIKFINNLPYNHIKNEIYILQKITMELRLNDKGRIESI